MLSKPPIVERQHGVRSVRACATHAGIRLLPAFDVGIEWTGQVLVSEKRWAPALFSSEILRRWKRRIVERFSLGSADIGCSFTCDREIELSGPLSLD